MEQHHHPVRAIVKIPLTQCSLLLLLLIAFLCVTHRTALAQQKNEERLILKDGSYQIVKTYEVKGDRVRYLSAERNEWEELPYSLVDWPATEKYEKDRAAAASSPGAVQLDKEAASERDLDDLQLPEVAPGLRLPEDEGVFLLETYRNQPQLVELQQSEGDVNRNVKANILRGALNPLASAKQTIELEGEHAAVQSHVDVPSFYLNVEDDSSSSPSVVPDTVRAAPDTPQQQQPQQPQKATVPFDRYRILKVETKGNKRIVGAIKRTVTGKVSQDEHVVKITINQVKGGWLKVTPTQPLAPGEYALIETAPDQSFNLMVWDFGVNPNAPQNAHPWMPDQKSAQPPNSSPPTNNP